MTTLNNLTEIKVTPSCQHNIEQYIENICDKLLINESYYGNLLTGINVLFSLLIDLQHNTRVSIGYKTDYHIINIVFTQVSRETVQFFNKKLAGNLPSDNLIILQNLTEDILAEEDKISLTFTIGAINDQISQFRKKLLNDYFCGFVSEKTIQSHDHF